MRPPSRPRVFYDSFLPFVELDHLIEAALSSQPAIPSNPSRYWRPRMDVYEDAERRTVIATIELPGLRKEDLQLELLDGRLTVSGEVPVPARGALRPGLAERSYGKFARSLSLPFGVKPEDIRAVLDSGLLTIEFPAGPARPPVRSPPVSPAHLINPRDPLLPALASSPLTSGSGSGSASAFGRAVTAVSTPLKLPVSPAVRADEQPAVAAAQ